MKLSSKNLAEIKRFDPEAYLLISTIKPLRKILFKILKLKLEAIRALICAHAILE